MAVGFPIDLVKLLDDVTTVLVPAVPAAGGLMIGYHAVMKSTSGDEQQAAQHSRSIRLVLINTVVGGAAAGLIKFAIAYIKP